MTGVQTCALPILVTKILTEPLEIWYLQLNDFRDRPCFEVKCRINGLSNRDNVREYLEEDILFSYERALLANAKNLNLRINYFFHISATKIIPLINDGLIKSSSNLHFCIYGYNEKLPEQVQALKNLNVKVYLHYQILKEINVLNLAKLRIDGIVINEGLQKETRDEVLLIARSFDLILITNHEFNDYEKCIYKTDELKREL